MRQTIVNEQDFSKRCKSNIIHLSIATQFKLASLNRLFKFSGGQWLPSEVSRPVMNLSEVASYSTIVFGVKTLVL